MTIDYLVCDINEDLVLGLRWLETVDPIINWKTRTWSWRDDKWPKDLVPVRAAMEAFTAMTARKARKRIVQGEIQSNDPPEWVKTEFACLWGARPDGYLPPRRPGLDYAFTMRDGWRPRREPQRRFSPEERRAFTSLADKETMNHRQGGWRWDISTSPQCSQMLWAAKAGDKKRPCHDYRGINAWMNDDQEPLPSIENMISQMSRYKYLTSIDLPKAYNQIRVADATITTSDGRTITLQEILAF